MNSQQIRELTLKLRNKNDKRVAFMNSELKRLNKTELEFALDEQLQKEIDQKFDELYSKNEI